MKSLQIHPPEINNFSLQSFHLKQDFPWNFYRIETWNLIILKARCNNQKERSLSIRSNFGIFFIVKWQKRFENRCSFFFLLNIICRTCWHALSSPHSLRHWTRDRDKRRVGSRRVGSGGLLVEATVMRECVPPFW